MILLLVFSNLVAANTFVGNGGDSTDFLLYATLKQIHETATRADTRSFCTCGGEGQHPFCEALDRLNQEQVLYCQQTFRSSQKELAEFSSAKTPIHFQWTEANILVNGRSFEAVANFKSRSITLNRKKFQEFSQARRVALITHELLHHVKEGALLDDGVIGPFQGEQGGRSLLDAMGASVAIASMGLRPEESFNYLIRGSKMYETHWLSLRISSDTYSPALKTLAGQDRSSTVDVGYQYHWEGLGVYGTWLQKTLDNKVGSLTLQEQISLLSIGMSYKINFKGDNTSRYGQSHILTKLGVGFGRSTYSLSDQFIQLSEKQSFLAPEAHAYYMFPLNGGFWLSAGIRIRYFDYIFSDFNVESKSLEIGIVPLGVSYGF